MPDFRQAKIAIRVKIENLEHDILKWRKELEVLDRMLIQQKFNPHERGWDLGISVITPPSWAQ